MVEKPWVAKGKSKETTTNFFDMKSRYATEYQERTSNLHCLHAATEAL